MCQHFSTEEMEECCKDPNFCVVCLCNGKNVIDYCCGDCRGELPCFSKKKIGWLK